MRGGRSLLVLLVVALGLGAYIYFVESKRDPLATETREKVFSVDTAAIEQIEVRAASGEVTTLRKAGEDDWQIAAPVSAPADETTVASITGALASTDITRVLDENAAAFDQFGLDPPRITVSFTLKGDATRRQLNLGNKTPSGTDTYARIDGQPRLFLIGGYLEDTFNRTTFDLRDKAVLAIEHEAVDAVTLERPSAPTIALKRQADSWRLAQPIDARADYSPVDSLVSRVDSAQMRSVELEGTEPTPAQLRTFGLDRPQLTATFGSGSSVARLAIGGKKDDSSVYARDLSRPLVFTVEASLLTDLQKPVDDLRVKDVFAFRSYTVTSIEIASGGSVVGFEKTTGAAAENASPASTWKQTKPQARDVDQTAVTDLLSTLSSLRADRFVERAPGTGEDTIVTATSGEGSSSTKEQVTLRRAGGAAYAIREGEPGAAVIPVGDVDKALGQLKSLIDSK
jgi:hypothetical protein